MSLLPIESRSRSPRCHLGALLGIAVLVLLAGCGGVDVSKQNFQRTTVPVSASAEQPGRVPTGPIEDPAVRLPKLRTIAPCGLLGSARLAELGESAKPEPQGWSQCRVEVTDAGGKTASIVLTIGEPLTADAEEATGGVGGLPLIVRGQDKSTCFVTAVTSKRPGIGITAQVEYEGGQPCRAGETVIGGVIETLHGQPPTLTEVPGSLATVDPCSVVGGKLVTDLIGADAQPSPSSLHGCAWRGAEPSLRVDFRVGYGPGDDDDGEQVDLGHGVTGYSERGVESASTCTVRWLHLPTGERTGEVVSVDYDNYAAEPAADKPCEKAVKLAEDVVPRLPKPA